MRTLVSLGAACAALVWLLAAWFVWALRCDQSCSGNEAGSWEWTGQGMVALAGAGAVFLAIGLAFTHDVRAQRTARAVAGGCALLWLSWLLVWGAPQG